MSDPICNCMTVETGDWEALRKNCPVHGDCRSVAQPDSPGGLSSAREAEIREHAQQEVCLVEDHWRRDIESLVAALAAVRQERDALQQEIAVCRKFFAKRHEINPTVSLRAIIGLEVGDLETRARLAYTQGAEAAEAARARLVALLQALPRFEKWNEETTTHTEWVEWSAVAAILAQEQEP